MAEVVDKEGVVVNPSSKEHRDALAANLDALKPYVEQAPYVAQVSAELDAHVRAYDSYDWIMEVNPPLPEGVKHRRTLVGYIERYKVAAELFAGDEEQTKQWLSTPAKALGGLAPVDATLEDVKDFVGRIETGTAS